MESEWAVTIDDPKGWEVRHDATWAYCRPRGILLPEQGWKVHISSTLPDCDVVLTRITEFCLEQKWMFKYLRSREQLRLSNDKDAPRASSGKFITIYPPAAAISPHLAERLAALLEGCRGPRILSDIQWRGSPVHFRHGAFVLLETWDGRPAVRSPSGALEPDRRGPVFSAPSWVDVPEWLTHQHRVLAEHTLSALDDTSIEGAFSFSNSGGVYRGTHPVHGDVVVKEGRELVADDGRSDAAERIEHEFAMLRRLRGTGLAPEPYDSFRSGDSAFVIMERIPGEPLNRAVFSRNPLTGREPSREARSSYARSVAEVIQSTRQQVSGLHAAGVVHGDIAPRNMVIRPDGAVRLIDFESSQRLDDGPGPLIGTPGFAAPAAVTGTDRDRHALACLHLAALVPLTSLIPLDVSRLDAIARAARAWFPDAPVDELRDCIRSFLPRAGSRSEAPTDQLGTAVAQPPRRGAREIVSVRDAMRVTRTGDLTNAHIELLLRAARTTERLDLEGGLAGIGVAALCARHLQPAPYLEQIAALAAERCRATLDRRHDIQALRPGLLNGPSGIALFLGMYDRMHGTQDALDQAMSLLEKDLERLRDDPSGGLQLAHDGRLVPFLASGSAGVGIAAIELASAGAPVDHGILRGIVRAAEPTFCVHAGVHDGRAGLMFFLIDVLRLGDTVADASTIRAMLAEHSAALELHRIGGAHGDRFPDRNLVTTDDGPEHGAQGIRDALHEAERCRARSATAAADLPSFLRSRSGAR